MVETEARLGARPGLTRISERRSEDLVLMSSAERCSSGSMSVRYFQRNGIALRVSRSWLSSSFLFVLSIAQNGAMWWR